MRTALLVWFLYFSFGGYAQTEVVFQVRYRQEVFALNDTIRDSVTHEKIVFKTVRFYISNPELIQGEERRCPDPKSVHLIDLERPESQSWIIPCTGNDFAAFRFGFGIDSVTNVSGAFGDDLDPVNGMYWAWQSGYINCKLEGYASFSTARDHSFEYHLGGYSGKQKGYQTVVFPVGKTDRLVVPFDLEAFIHQVRMQKLSHLMSPSETAAKLALVLSQSFE